MPEPRRIRKGDMVRCRMLREGIDAAYVVSWSGHPDHHVLLIDADHETYKPLAHECTHVDGLTETQETIKTYLRSRAGKGVIKAARSRATMTIHRGKRTSHIREVPPPQSFGSPSRHDIPLVIAEGKTSNPNEALMRYLTRPQIDYAMEMVRLRNPAWHAVLMENLFGEQSLREVAAKLGITYDATRQRKVRGMRALREVVRESASELCRIEEEVAA